MLKKVVGVFIMTLLIATMLPVTGNLIEIDNVLFNGFYDSDNCFQNNAVSLGNDDTVLWDNGLHYFGYWTSQWDPEFPFDAIVADDFEFADTSIVTGINWIGGYLNPPEDGDFDWNITFYIDSGDGNSPGNVIYKQIFSNEEVHETYLEFFEVPEDPNLNGYIFSYWVELDEPITFDSGEKYWLSVQGLGAFPPQSAWSTHIPKVNHNFVFKSNYWNIPEWSDYMNDQEFFADTCFQLTGEGREPVADLEGGGNLVWEDVTAGSLINGTFFISNVGDVGSMLGWEVLSLPEDWGTNWTIRWIREGELAPFEGGFVGITNPEEVFVQVQVPDEKNGNFSGEIVLVNVDDPTDTCTINLVCKTPRSRELHQVYYLIEILCERFPILHYLL